MSGNQSGAPRTGPVRLDTPLTLDAGIEVPLICGPMYPCSNPELVAAASQAGALGVLQPVSLTYVYGHDLRDGIRLIRRVTDRPIGMNALIEASSKTYRARMERWIDVALEEGIRFFVTSLGKPDWVVERVHAVGGHVYHDVTARTWALKGRDGGVDGFIAVNSRAGGHAGSMTMEELLDDVGDLGLPVVCAGGVATGEGVAEALSLGYAGVQMGTRFIATAECRASDSYKRAILEAGAEDIVLTERLTGVPLSVIETPYVRRLGTTAGAVARWLLGHRRTKHLMRTLYALMSLRRLKRASLEPSGEAEYWQAGRSVDSIDRVVPVHAVVDEVRRAILARSAE